MTAPLKVISSMATRQLLADLLELFHAGSALRVEVESVGGVDAAKRVQAGEAFDGVVLAGNAIEQLLQDGKLLPGSRVDLVSSGTAVAVKAGAARPDIGTEDAFKQALLAARSLGYSTGPSGVALTRLFERWGIADALKDRIVQAPAGVPVGSLVADGRAEIGIQQFSELMSVPGITVLGPLPPSIQITTVFSAAVASTSGRPDDVRTLLAFLASPDTADIKRRNGMDPA